MNAKYELLTTFESFEHFEDPLIEITKIATFSENIIFSTQPIPKPLPAQHDWWYYAFEHGQHIAFYSRKNFEVIAKKFELHYYSINNMHLFTKNKLGLAGRLLFSFKYAKHILFAASYFLTGFMKSRTMSDMNDLK